MTPRSLTGFWPAPQWSMVRGSKNARERPQVPLPARLRAVADRIDTLTTIIGHAVAWGLLVMVIVQVVVVLSRYVLGIGSIWLQETIIYAHATLFMLAAAWTLQQGGHVRVDVFYVDASPRRKALVDLLGAVVLLFPFSIALALLAMPYVARSWAVLEHSRETSGLPLVFLLKTLIPLFALLLGLQGIGQAIRAVTVLIGTSDR
jgi:TRAP-type mannitol/chloroaromatic compound transport system permease small subunit